MRMSFKRTIAGAMALTLSLVLIAGCGTKTQSPTPAPAGGAPAPAAAPAEPVKLTFWHAMGGKNGEAVQALVDKFNQSQKTITVEAQYQGSYDEALQKLKAAGANGPAVIQVYEIGSRFMIDSGLVTPVQKFIDADKFKMDDLEPNIVNYYKFDGKFYSLPFNTSTPIMYYNKTAFKEAGLDPAKPPTTFDEFAAAAKALTKKDAAGNIRYGASIAFYGWFFEQFLAEANAPFVDNGNGRDKKATKAAIATPEAEQMLTWMKTMIDQGYAQNLGRKTGDTQKAFQSGQIAMTLDSTGVVAQMVGGAGDKFEVGTAFLPKPSKDSKGGVIIGGASLWVTNYRPEPEQKAAWEFMKWLSLPEQQAFFHVKTGYFPIRQSAYEQADVKANLAKFPQYKTAIDQLHASPGTTATSGAVIGVFPQARAKIEDLMEATVLNKSTAKDGLAQANADITKAIESYNKSN